MLRLAVAVSGGADSTALQVEAARRFPPEQVIVLSVDHGTRAAAADERAHGAAIAARFGFAFQELGIQPARPNQAAWREARLKALLGYCDTHGIGTLWLGQHWDDAVETAALRLLAGGNLPSLAGISASRCDGTIRIERPLLSRPARQIRRELMSQGIGWYEDPSNRDTHYRRVAIRSLAPGIGQRLKPTSLVRRTGYWRAAREQALADAWQLAASDGRTGSLYLDPAVMQKLPAVMAQALLRKAALSAAGREQRVRKADFAAALALGAPPWQLGGVRVWTHQARWLVGRDYRHVRDNISLQPGSEIVWDARDRLVVPVMVPPGGWRASRLGLTAARRLRLDLPAEWAAAALAIWDGGMLVAVPAFDLWFGASSAYWAKNLSWNPPKVADTGLFRVAP